MTLWFPELTTLAYCFTSLDAVTRTVYYKYYHPKEVYVSNGVLNREINRAAGKRVGPAPTTFDAVPEPGRFNPK